MTRTFGDSVALASPSGKMSKAALRRAQQRIAAELFPPGFWATTKAEETPVNRCLRQAVELRALAARGMSPRTYLRQAQILENEAANLRGENAPNGGSAKKGA